MQVSSLRAVELEILGDTSQNLLREALPRSPPSVTLWWSFNSYHPTAFKREP
jgi:hypothetical protein